VLVTEGSETSGAMITARCAEQQGRDIFALPGNAGEKSSAGTNKLLVEEKAQLALSAYDILAKYVAQYPYEIDLSKLSQFASSKKSPLMSDLKVASKKPVVTDSFYESYDNRSKPKADRKNKKDTAAPELKNTVQSHEQNDESNLELSELADRKYVEKLMADITDDMYEVINSEYIEDGSKEIPAANRDLAGENLSGSVEKTLDLGKTERSIYDSMSDTEPMSADDIIHNGFSVSDVFRSLTLLEINGAVEALPGGLYLKKKI